VGLLLTGMRNCIIGWAVLVLSLQPSALHCNGSIGAAA
jgi:hypothetical protein